MLNHLHLIRPWWLLALIPWALLVWRLYFSQSASNSWRKVCDPQLLPHLLVNQTKVSKRGPRYIIALAWLVAILALTGPSWSRLPQTVYRSLAGEVVVFDLSPNMFATDIKPSRLQRAKFKLMDLLKRINQNSIGLTAFSGEAYTVSPLTQDAHTITAMVSEMSPNIMPAIGDNIAAGLQQGAKLLKQGGTNPGSIILITGSSADDAAITTAKKLASQGIKINVLGIGTETGSPIPLAHGGFMQNKSGNMQLAKLDIASLEKLAQAGNGKYIAFSRSNNDIKQIIQATNQGQHAVKSGVAKAAWRDQGRWLILLLVLLAVFAFRRGWFEELTL